MKITDTIQGNKEPLYKSEFFAGKGVRELTLHEQLMKVNPAKIDDIPDFSRYKRKSGTVRKTKKTDDNTS